MTTENPILIAFTEGRLNGCSKYLVDSFFSGKNVLEAGYKAPSAGPKLADLGATVTIYDISQGNLDAIKSIHPSITTELVDLTTETVRQKYDVIWTAESLDNLFSPAPFLQTILQNCDYLILDTQVCDSNDPSIEFVTLYDGVRVTPVYVNSVLQANGFDSIMPIDGVFDANSRWHGWEATNDGNSRDNLCRIWIAWRSSVTSPLKPAPAPEPAPAPAPEPVPE